MPHINASASRTLRLIAGALFAGVLVGLPLTTVYAQNSLGSAPAPTSGSPDTVTPPTPDNQAGTSGGGSSQCDNGGGSGVIANPLKFCSLEQVLGALLDAVIKIGSIVLMLVLMYSGFQFVAAQGNEEKISKARNALMWTVIGGLILLGAKGIEVVISSTISSVTS
jgi:hypothetical protein